MKKLFLLIAFAFISWSAGAQTQLWGTCAWGGSANAGTIFTADGNGNNFHSVYSFDSIHGKLPLGKLTLANNGSFYGVTAEGGFNDSCVCFRYDPSTGVYTDIHELAQYQSLGYGASDMLYASDGNLYGLCSAGGAYYYGVIYKINPTTDTYSDVFDFNDTTSGSSPYYGLMQATDGNLYGYTSGGGVHKGGVLFKYNVSTSLFTKLFDFDSITGYLPQNGTLIQATDGKLYGATYLGGSHNLGVIYSYDISTNTYSDLYDMQIGNHDNGLIQATDGKLYGTLGTNYSVMMDGLIFSFDINTNTYAIVHVFNGTDGSIPLNILIQGSNGKLLGTTSNGGTNNAGVAFSYDISTSTYTKLVDFDAANLGGGPQCTLAETPLITNISSLLNNPSIKTYPNPATTILTISISSFTANQQLIITDVLGREIYKSLILNPQSIINVSQWNNGVYFYQLIDDKETKAGKFVVSH